MVANNSQNSWKKGIAALALLAIGLILIVIQAIINSGSFVQSWFIHPEHPQTYRFPVYSQLLKNNVKGGLVNYKTLQTEKQLLNNAVNDLEHISPFQMENQSEQLTFWINTYNLLVLKIIVDKYPIKDTEHLSQTFNLHKFIIGGKPYSIEQIRTNFIEPTIKESDNKILFTICSARMGDPPLLDHALEPKLLESDASSACIQFINDSRNVYFNNDTATLVISPFFKWHENILCKQFESPFLFVNFYLYPPNKVDLSDYHIKTAYFTNFDWRLNDTNQIK